MNTGLAGLTAAVMATLGLKANAADEDQAAAILAADAPRTDDPVSAGNPNDKKEPDMTDATAAAPTATAPEVEAVASAAAAQATAAANTRWADVMACEEAKGREALAINLLGNAALDAATVKAALAVAPKGAATAGLAERMADVPNPAVNANGGGEPAAPTAQSAWDKAIAKTHGALRK